MATFVATMVVVNGGPCINIAGFGSLQLEFRFVSKVHVIDFIPLADQGCHRVRPSVRVTCPSVRVSWTGLSSVRLALGLLEGKLGVTCAYVANMSHSK